MSCAEVDEVGKRRSRRDTSGISRMVILIGFELEITLNDVLGLQKDSMYELNNSIIAISYKNAFRIILA